MKKGWSDKEILVQETIGVRRASEMVRVGVPCAEGELEEPLALQLLNQAEEPLPLQFEVLSRWPDGSVKWLSLDFPATVSPNERAVYRLARGEKSALAEAPSIKLTRGHEFWRVTTGSAEFWLNTRTLAPFSRIIIGGHDILAPEGSSFRLSLAEKGEVVPVMETLSLESEGPLHCILRLNGRFPGSPLSSPRVVCRLHFFAASSVAHLEITLDNPQAARHPGGLWDLGDPGSLIFEKFLLDLPLFNGEAGRLVCSPQPGEGDVVLHRRDFRAFSICQGSSGGRNWRSPNHRSRDGEVHLSLPGYRLSLDGKKLAEGRRATPVVWYGGDRSGVAAVMPYFWQEFPRSIEMDQHGLKAGFFPGEQGELHELQGGEQKTVSLYLDFASSPSGLAWARGPLLAVPSPATCRHSGVFPDLPAIPGEGETDLVDRIITPAELSGKRETVDEYGWRNFGECYADHEGVYHKGPQPLLSHYNNQYDICGGLYRKFFASGDPAWGELAGDLARHVLDIDIYHTDQDREEYNGGLFWHTDHYIDAGLSTHRSFSKEHLQIKDPRFCGGGPGSEHCYTTGLLLHYYQTGNPSYRSAVLGLAEWCYRTITAPNTFLGVVKRSVGQISHWRGSRNCALTPALPRFPLSRGTGNAITASLDAFEAAGERKYLERAEELIRGAVHPGDDIDARDLPDAENCWSYTVLLGAVANFLRIKMLLEELDTGFEYARDSLLAYARWMSLHEYPFLEKPEILEYPNETWAAQDLRKAVVLHQAAGYAKPDEQRLFLDKAKSLFDAAQKQLLEQPTKQYTRPVALVLQNGWIGSRLSECDVQLPPQAKMERRWQGKTPLLSLGSVVQALGRDLKRAAANTSLNREAAWLRHRMRG